MSTNLILDDSGDIMLSAGALVIADDLAQRLRVRLRWFKGECARDPNGGTPYVAAILGVQYDATTVQHALTPIILGTEGVQRIESFASTLDQLSRKVFVSFVVKSTSNDVIAVEVPL